MSRGAFRVRETRRVGETPMNEVLFETDLRELPLAFRGKVRDVYDAGDALLLVATDRLSAFDVVLPTPIPDKGRVLTAVSRFWFERTQHLIPNHLLERSAGDILSPAAAEPIESRSMVVRKAKPLRLEAVVRGYLAGSAWAEYEQKGSVCGIELPVGLRQADRLPEPIFTPATKAERGDHDENITFAEAARIAGAETTAQVRNASLALYRFGAAWAEERGIIIADTKFEFGFHDGRLILIDEVMTPDSSRFWPRDEYVPGASPPSFDKQYVRDYLVGIGWDKQPPGPDLPPEVVRRTSEKYREALRRLTA